MFGFNRETEYALALLKELKNLKAGEFLSLRKFAKAYDYSLLLMQKVARSLRRHRIIASKRGKYGGYFLVERPQNVSIKDVVEIFEGGCGIVSCFRGKKCPMKDVCRQKKGLKYLDKAILGILEEVKVASL